MRKPGELLTQSLSSVKTKSLVQALSVSQPLTTEAAKAKASLELPKFTQAAVAEPAQNVGLVTACLTLGSKVQDTQGFVLPLPQFHALNRFKASHRIITNIY